MPPSTTDPRAPSPSPVTTRASSTRREAVVLFTAVLATACRFGGPSGDPTLPSVDAAAGSAGSGGPAGTAGNGGQGGQAGSGGMAGEAGSTSTGGSAGATVDASDDVAGDAAPDNGPDDDADVRDGRVDVDVSSDASSLDVGPPTVCAPPFSSAVCDPVCNTGCPALFRCDITDTPRTGVCVGTLLSPSTEGMACTRTPLTDDCVERLSCIEGTCRRLCYRDTDCATMGTCCVGAVDVDGGPSGYRLCAPCGP